MNSSSSRVHKAFVAKKKATINPLNNREIKATTQNDKEN